jgi:predicted RNase H-like nuclease (RuvC/YqgF family)
MINDELQQFQKLLEENNKQLRQEIREDIRAEVDPLHERLDAQQKRFTTVEKNLSAQISTVAKNISSVEKNLSEQITRTSPKILLSATDLT